MLLKYIQNLKENTDDITLVSIVTFNDNLNYLIRNMHVEQISHIPEFVINGCTCLYGTVSTVISEYINDTNTIYNMYIINDGDDTSSSYYTKQSTDLLCSQVIDTSRWFIVHYNTEDPNITPVQYVKIDMNNLDNILNGLKL